MQPVHGQLLHMLRSVAIAIGDDLRERLVFVGGCTTILFITDPITFDDVRATDDVDVIVDLVGYGGWTQLQDQLREKGFSESPDDDVICRMGHGGLKVDFMPDDPDILGFSNRWYARGIETAISCELSDSLTIKRLASPLFIATKLEAYNGRGNDDPLGSHDLEDILIVIDGREELVDEVTRADRDVRDYISEQISNLLNHYDFDSFLEGNIRGPEGRAEIVRDRLEALCSCNCDV